MYSRFIVAFCLGIVLSAISPDLFCQRDFRPGYIISLNNDTVPGLVLYTAINTSNVCTFRKNADSATTNYSPSEILGYRFNEGKLFVSKMVTLAEGDKLVFLEFLIKGKANIYYMRDGTDHYFVENEHGLLLQLTEPEKVISGKNGVGYVKPEQYTGRLKLAMSDCPEIFPEIERSSLNHSSLVKLARDYHIKVCTTEQCIVFERKRPALHVRFGFYGGLSVNRVKFGGKPYTKTVGDQVVVDGDQLVSDYRPGGMLGCRMEFENILSSFEHASIMIDLAVQGFYTYNLTETGEYDQIVYEDIEYRLIRHASPLYLTNLDVNLKTYLLQVPIKINYTFLKGRWRPFLNAGIMNYFLLSQNSELEVIRFTEEFNRSIPFYHIGFTGSMGTRVMLPGDRFIFVEAGYTFTQTTSTWPDLRFINSLFDFKAGISF